MTLQRVARWGGVVAMRLTGLVSAWFGCMIGSLAGREWWTTGMLSVSGTPMNWKAYVLVVFMSVYMAVTGVWYLIRRSPWKI